MIIENANLGTFPFGRKVIKISQSDRSPKPVFILGVYGSAVFAQFKELNSKESIRYLPVDNEPEIFWNGDKETVKKIISELKLPTNIGKLHPEFNSVNGILGRLLDKYYLHPLKLKRENVWLCNLVPHYVLNKNERKSVKKYNDIRYDFSLPKAEIETKKDQRNYLTKSRLSEIIEDILLSRAEIIITLGQQPLKWIVQKYNNDLGNPLNVNNYGSLSRIRLGSLRIKLIPLFHPRQLLKEKHRDTKVGLLHYDWLKTKAKKIQLL